MQFLLYGTLASIGFCWFMQRLAIQSSYYADPKRRFCGTLEKFMALMAKASNITTSRIGMKPAPLNRDELKHYAGVKQFWFNPLKAPQCNKWADARFKERRKEMARREAETKAALPDDMPPMKKWQIVLFAALLVGTGLLAFFSLPV